MFNTRTVDLHSPGTADLAVIFLEAWHVGRGTQQTFVLSEKDRTVCLVAVAGCYLVRVSVVVHGGLVGMG